MYKSLKIIGLNLLLLFVAVKLGKNIVYRNISISEPLGYYLALPGLPIAKGDLVLTCISNGRYTHVFNALGMKNVTGQCANGLPYLIKQIAAAKGDKVDVTTAGITINGALQANSKQFSHGRGVNLYPLPIGYSHVLTADEYFMLGQSSHSLDSRYFGIVKKNDVYRRAILIYELNYDNRGAK